MATSTPRQGLCLCCTPGPLSIEEQFYLLFPGLLIVLHRYKKEWLFKAVLAIGLLSFALNLFFYLQ